MVAKNVKLRIGDHEDEAVDIAITTAFPLKLQLDSVCGVHQACAAALHGPVGHRAEVNQQPEPVPGQEEFQIHVLCFIFFFHEKSADLSPEVGANNAFVVKHVGRSVDCYLDFCQVGKDVFFRITRAMRIRLHEQKEDGFHRPPLGVQPFQQGGASTPYRHGEQIEMQTRQHEQTGLPSYEENSFGGDDERADRAALLRRKLFWR